MTEEWLIDCVTGFWLKAGSGDGCQRAPHAEKAFAVVIVRRGEGSELVALTISDGIRRLWSKCTLDSATLCDNCLNAHVAKMQDTISVCDR
jgi:hypothetical protein